MICKRQWVIVHDLWYMIVIPIERSEIVLIAMTRSRMTMSRWEVFPSLYGITITVDVSESFAHLAQLCLAGGNGIHSEPF